MHKQQALLKILPAELHQNYDFSSQGWQCIDDTAQPFNKIHNQWEKL